MTPAPVDVKVVKSVYITLSVVIRASKAPALGRKGAEEVREGPRETLDRVLRGLEGRRWFLRGGI